MKVTTWIIAAHDEQAKAGPKIIKVFGNMYDVEEFIIKEIQKAEKKYPQWRIDRKRSTTELGDFEETSDGVAYGYAYFDNIATDKRPFKISYSACDENDIEYVEINE